MSKPKTLLVFLPLFWPKLPPLGIAYLQAYALKNGFAVDLLDLNNIFYNLSTDDLKKAWLVSCNASLEENVLSLIQKNYSREYHKALETMMSYEVIGFSCFRSNFKTTLEIARVLKSKRKRIKIIFGGPEITRQYFKTRGKFDKELQESSDFLVAGEGEKPFLSFLENKQDASVVLFDELKDLGALPFPRYEGLDLRSYPRKNAISLFFSRGCLRHCRFCSERLLYQKFRSGSVKNLIEEIKFHKSRGIEYFIFNDSLINADLKKLESFCDKIIGSFGPVAWEAQLAVRADMNDGLLEKMKKSGCYNLFVGLESGSGKVLKMMNKGFTTQEAVKFFKKLKKADLNFGISLIVGYPGETQKDFKESLDFIVKNKDLILKVEQINPFVYYDGTSVKMGKEDASVPEAVRRMETFVVALREHGIKYTNAFVGNLLEK